MEVDIPEVRAELEAVFAAYEAALLANDAAVLDAMFWAASATVRYGVADNQHGIEEIRLFRAAQYPFDRTLARTVITTFGTDFGIASTLFHRPDFPDWTGRQMQTWVRLGGQWRVVAAHVSMVESGLLDASETPH